MKIFEQYVKKFDMNNANIKVKYFQLLIVYYGTIFMLASYLKLEQNMQI